MNKKLGIPGLMTAAFFLLSCASTSAPVTRTRLPTEGPAPKGKVTVLEKEPVRTDFTISGTVNAGAAGYSLEPGASIVLLEADLDGTSVLDITGSSRCVVGPDGSWKFSMHRIQKPYDVRLWYVKPDRGVIFKGNYTVRFGGDDSLENKLVLGDNMERQETIKLSGMISSDNKKLSLEGIVGFMVSNADGTSGGSLSRGKTAPDGSWTIYALKSDVPRKGRFGFSEGGELDREIYSMHIGNDEYTVGGKDLSGIELIPDKNMTFTELM